MELIDRIQLGLQHGWNAFMGRDPSYPTQSGPGYSHRPDRSRFTRGNERTIVTSIFNKIALDVSNIDIIHCKTDENGCYVETVNSGLNNCLNLEANIDQTGRAFIQDVVQSMLDEGCVAIVPTDTDLDPNLTGGYDVLTMRTGKILEWYPDKVKVRLYNENKGIKEDKILPKKMVAIIENPLYAVVNEPNSTLQRLVKKLALLDAVDEQSSSGKLDMIIQLPYAIKSDTRREQAEKRRNDIIEQIKGPLGIAYTDSTEKIVQLNRPIENNLMKQVEYLTNQLWGQLGFTQGILDGTADESTMRNYYARIIKPIVAAIVDEMKRKFLTKTARTKLHTIMYFQDPFELVPINTMADIADKFTRNEIMAANEIRQKIGMKPSKDPRADQLINSNLNHTPEELADRMEAAESDENSESSDNGHSLGSMRVSDLPDM